MPIWPHLNTVFGMILCKYTEKMFAEYIVVLNKTFLYQPQL